MTVLQNDTFLRALRRQPTEYTPLWLMRQAGRYLPEYNATRARAGSFLGLAKNPAYATEVTLQPLDRYPLDAAILFSDILTVPDAMGLGLSFAQGEGPRFAHPLRTEADVARLAVPDMASLQYVFDAVSEIRRALVQDGRQRVPLIGFSGSPWTLACYMVEGGGSRHYVEVKKLMYNSPAIWEELVDKLVDVLAEYSAEQVRHGADVIQIFDSWVGCLSVEDYRRYALEPTKRLVQRLQKKAGVPIIYFGTDSATLLPSMSETGAEVIGLDWRVPLDEGWKIVGHQHAVQGNLDPVTLFASWNEVKQRAELILRLADGRPGHIFNLGHGILPYTPVDNVKKLAEFVHEFSTAAGAARES